MSGISGLDGVANAAHYNAKAAENSTSLNLDDFLSLIIAQFQNQDPNNPADTKDMMNYMVQMSVMQAITNITDATTTMYAASLVGKDVTVGQYNKQGVLEEVHGTVMGTGTYGGQQVIFVDGVSYYLSSIMAVGELPDDAAKEASQETGEETVENAEEASQT